MRQKLFDHVKKKYKAGPEYLWKRYRSDKFTFDLLKEEYGIYAIRGPRGIPNSLSAALNPADTGH